MKIALLSLLALSISLSARAGEFGCQRCVSCGGRCVLRMQPTTTTETCYDIEYQGICIPAVRFPWDHGPARCGRSRLVTRLTSETREKPACDYEWVSICDRCGRARQDEASMKTPPWPPAPKAPRETAQETAKTPGAIWLTESRIGRMALGTRNTNPKR